MAKLSSVVLGAFLAVQVLDAALTYQGICQFGRSAEGNVILGTWMGLVGDVPALIGAKLVASACGVLVYSLVGARILAPLTAFYVVSAIVPWLRIL